MKYVEEFPLVSNKVAGVADSFDLNTVAGRKAYFEAKRGDKIANIKKYLQDHTFIAYLLAKKNAGKGTYTKQMIEIFGEDLIGHVSIGDAVRNAYQDAQTEDGLAELRDYMEIHYRGFMSLDDALGALLDKSVSKLLPAEFTLALAKREIQKQGRKAIFMDGFPRTIDQLSYSLFFKDLIDFRSDPDIFIAIDCPESVIEARMQNRVVCPVCQAPNNFLFHPTERAGYDQETEQFYLQCDNAACDGARMVPKEGDADGLEKQRERFKTEGELIDKIFSLHGVPKILLRNAVSVAAATDYYDDYEIVPAFSYEQGADGQVVRAENVYTATDDEGEEVASLIAPAVVPQLIDQLHTVLGLDHD